LLITEDSLVTRRCFAKPSL